MGRKACFTLVLLAFVCGAVYCTYVTLVKPSSNQEPSRPDPVAVDFSSRVPVPLNRGPEVADGFRGEVHPVLKRHSKLQVTARWSFDRNQVGSPAFLYQWPSAVHDLFQALNVSIPTRTYGERDFSRFLPEKEPGAVGQTWALDLEKVAELLKQFHPAPSMRLVAKGRRPGPNGAFAVLRAVSASHLDILFRAHAEFDVVPDHKKWRSLVTEAWYSPSCFLGRLVINREAGTVEYFRLGLATDNKYNVHVTAVGKSDEGHGWMCVDRMDLVGGSLRNAESLRWADQIEAGEAYDRLAKIFYKFKEINWVPFERVQETARAQKKPIFVVAAQGALDNQTC